MPRNSEAGLVRVKRTTDGGAEYYEKVRKADANTAQKTADAKPVTSARTTTKDK